MINNSNDDQQNQHQLQIKHNQTKPGHANIFQNKKKMISWTRMKITITNRVTFVKPTNTPPLSRTPDKWLRATVRVLPVFCSSMAACHYRLDLNRTRRPDTSLSLSSIFVFARVWSAGSSSLPLKREF